MTETRSDRALEPEGRPGDDGLSRLARLRQFVREVVAELRKVIWPTRNELTSYTTVVLVFVVVMIAIIYGFDFAFSNLMLFLFD